jgi:hypothetical protein
MRLAPACEKKIQRIVDRPESNRLWITSFRIQWFAFVMNLVRTFISVFVVALSVVSVYGWIWAGHQETEYVRNGARVVLALCFLASLGCLVLIWREKPQMVAGDEDEGGSSQVA